MNCKQGDLAVIVRSFAGNEGKIVRCIRFIPHVLWERTADVGGWEIDAGLTDYEGGTGNLIADSQLRPIRDNYGEDEMLRIAGLPREVEPA